MAAWTEVYGTTFSNSQRYSSDGPGKTVNNYRTIVELESSFWAFSPVFFMGGFMSKSGILPEAYRAYVSRIFKVSAGYS